MTDARSRELAAKLILPPAEHGIYDADSIPEEMRDKMERSHLSLRKQATEAFVRGDAMWVIGSFSNTYGLWIVEANAAALLERGIYEAALVDAYIGTRVNWAGWSLPDLLALLTRADRERLREAGDPMPEGERFTLYRGVAGRRPARKVAGLSWTRSLAAAAWFAAARFPGRFADPAVYVTEADRSDVYFYSNERGEDDFILRARSYRRLGSDALAEAAKFKEVRA